ncbi:coiled-coil domain-containing protein [Stackebrandtia soli]|uniref:coiled-coil domain-containing protein n=1 Tax=Stackebrandtia soli TaxID=1892856 RepID=UPI0039ECB4CA
MAPQLPRRAPRNRRRALVAAMAALLVLISPSTALADPDETDLGGDLSAALEEFLEAEEYLHETEERQAEIKKEIKAGKKAVKALSAEIDEFAAAAYRNGGTSTFTAILTTGSPNAAVDSITIVNFLGDQSGRRIQDLIDAKEELEAEKEALADEQKAAEKALKKSQKARDAAANALAANGGNSLPGPSLSDARAPIPAPRNGDGSLPSEGCQVDDPTPANGCLTPRTKHMLTEAQSSGFQRYVSCYRGGGFGEHPMGRACDFSSQAGGFGGVAGGEDKAYGDNLAGWFVQYAQELGVMYVIWYNQYWDPAQGWIAYNGGGGDPSSDHTNHVHVSMR